MAEHHDEHGQDGHGGHGAPSAGEWLETHLGGLIVPFGERLEVFFDRTMFLIVNGFFMRAAAISVAIMTPVLLIEFMVRTIRF